MKRFLSLLILLFLTSTSAASIFYPPPTAPALDPDPVFPTLPKSVQVGGDISQLNNDANYQTDVEVQATVDAVTTSDLDLGWAQFNDTTFTVGSPLTIPSGVRTEMPIDNDTTITSFAPAGGATWVDNGVFSPTTIGDFYIIRVTLTAQATLNNRNFTVDLDIGTPGSPIIIWEQTYRLARGAGNATKMSVVIPVYTLGTFLTNGGKLFITCDGDVDVYDIITLIHKSSTGS